MSNDVLAIALAYYDAGLTPIPIALDGSKSPATKTWRGFYKKRPTREQVERLFKDKACGLAVLGGPCSGGLEILDFDDPASFPDWLDLVQTMAPGLVERLPLVRTPSHGYHVFWRTDVTEGNRKLAMTKNTEGGKLETKIETRGNGGYVLAIGCPGEAHPSGVPYRYADGSDLFATRVTLVNTPKITDEERAIMIDAARSLNEVAENDEPPRKHDTSPTGDGRPGDDFEARASWDEILAPHGWKAVRHRGEVTHWRRPGKDDKGISATTGVRGVGGKLYVFSSNAHPFDASHAYSKFRAYALLTHAGDFIAAAKALHAAGYGERARQKAERAAAPVRHNFAELNRRLDDAFAPRPRADDAPPLDDAPIPSDDDAPADVAPSKLHGITADQLEAMLDDDAAACMRPGIFERLIAMREDRAEWLLIGDVLRRKKKKADFMRAVKEYDSRQKREANRDSWKERLLYRETKDGEQILDKCLANLVEILTHDESWRGVIALDEFAQQIVCRQVPPIHRKSGSRWSDADVAEVKAWIERAYAIRPTTGDVNDAVIVVARRQAFSSLRDYFDALPEARDGESMIDTWLVDFFGAKDTPYTRAVGAKWLISAVARAFEPGAKVDTVLILEGKQGLRKSSVLEKLCPTREWFADGLSEFGSRAQAEEIEGKWIVELAEMSGFKRAEIEQIKAFVTRTAENYRPAYGRHVIHSPRKCVFAATVNPGGDGYLKDETGNRRFWPVKCERIASDLTPAMRDALWAEAKARYLLGEKWYFDAEHERAIIEEAQAEQQQRVVTDPWQELIEDELIGQEETSVNDMLDKLKVDKAKRTGAESVRVGRILTMLGWERRFKHTAPRGWRYVKPPPQLKLVS
jgi:predicted P-loop ATPase